MKRVSITHDARLALREDRPTGYTLGAKLIAQRDGRSFTTGNRPVDWFSQGDETLVPRTTVTDESGETRVLRRFFEPSGVSRI